MAAVRLCSVPDCDNPHDARGYCSQHYQRWKKHGDVQAHIPLKRKVRGICAVDGCGKPHSTHGYCYTHSRFFRLYGDPLKRLRHPKPERCDVDGCDRPVKQNRLCTKHYMRLRQNGHPLAGATDKGALLKFLLEHVGYEGDDCVLWPYARDENGYGKLWYKGKNVKASRAMCLEAHGEPPTPEHEAAHSCGKGHLGCINPNHIRWATMLENEHDKLLHGTVARGERNGHARLTEEDVREIRRLEGKVSRSELAARFRVSRGHIGDLQRRTRWAWLD